MKHAPFSVLRLTAAALCALLLLSPFAGIRADAKEDPMVLVREDYNGRWKKSTTYEYDANGFLIRKTEDGNEVTEFTYYSNGVLKEELKRYEENGYKGAVLYNAVYRRDGTIYKELQNYYDKNGNLSEVETTEYDAMENPTTAKWSIYTKAANSSTPTLDRCITTTYENTYDDWGRLTARTTLDDVTTEVIEETWWYDGEGGNITHSRNVFVDYRISTRELYVINGAGQVTAYVCSMWEGVPVNNTSYSIYDEFGTPVYQENSSKAISPGGQYLGGDSYTYTPVYRDGLLQQVTKIGVTFECDENGIDSTTIPSHTSMRCEYDREGRRISEIHFKQDGTEHYSIRWTYDKKGNLTCYDHSDQGTTTYTYAPLSSVKTK